MTLARRRVFFMNAPSTNQYFNRLSSLLNVSRRSFPGFIRECLRAQNQLRSGIIAALLDREQP
jgi:hypothetical protein